MAKIDTLFKTKTVRNHTLWGRTYLYNPYKKDELKQVEVNSKILLTLATVLCSWGMKKKSVQADHGNGFIS